MMKRLQVWKLKLHWRMVKMLYWRLARTEMWRMKRHKWRLKLH